MSIEFSKISGFVWKLKDPGLLLYCYVIMTIVFTAFCQDSGLVLTLILFCFLKKTFLPFFFILCCFLFSFLWSLLSVIFHADFLLSLFSSICLLFLLLGITFPFWILGTFILNCFVFCYLGLACVAFIFLKHFLWAIDFGFI